MTLEAQYYIKAVCVTWLPSQHFISKELLLKYSMTKHSVYDHAKTINPLNNAYINFPADIILQTKKKSFVCSKQNIAS